MMTFLIACDNPKEGLPEKYQVSQFNINAEGEVRDIIFPDDSLWLVCGGNRNKNGYIYASNDKGESWNQCFKTDDASINALYYSDKANFWAAGDSIRIWRSDNGQSWYENPRAPCYWNNCENPYYAIHIWGKHHVFAVGGEYFQRGITSESGTGVSYWIQLYWPNQWNDLYVDGYDVIVAGYGMVIQSTDTVENFNDMDVYRENFTGLAVNRNNELFMLAEQGKIYQLINETEWSEKSEIKGRFRDLGFNTNLGCVVGDDACIGISENDGYTWQQYRFVSNEHLSCVKADGNVFLIGTCSGKLFGMEMR